MIVVIGIVYGLSMMALGIVVGYVLRMEEEKK
jgi:hypothetical protein